MRHSEIRTLQWKHIDFNKRAVTVGRSKTEAGTGRTLPLTSDTEPVLLRHAEWYKDRFGVLNPDWFVFPGRVGRPELGASRPYDPTRHTSSLKTVWRNVKMKAGVQGRLHDARHTLITELCENPDVADQTIREVVGHVSARMMARYSHIRMNAKRDALEGTAERNRVKRTDGAESPSTKSTTAGV
jgi:integrase